MSERCDRPAPLLVSCLCVTENRAAFMPWLLWNYDRQTWQRRELVVVDSSAEPLKVAGREDVRVVAARRGASVGRKRNLALEHARGEIVTWFDDDDWQHPEKLAWLVAGLAGREPYAGAAVSWFLDLASGSCTRYGGLGRRVLFNSAGFRRRTVHSVPFPETVVKASDTRWMCALERRLRSRGRLLDKPLFFWLSHRTNLSNPSRKRRFGGSMEKLASWVGEEAWQGTEEQLGALRHRLEPARGGPKETRMRKPGRRPSAAPARIARRAIERPSPEIPMYWFRGRGRSNFGDALSPLVVRALSDRPVRFVARGPRLVAIGSVLNVAGDGDTVWGAGFRDPRHQCSPRARLLAVRGPLTRELLLARGYRCPPVYGDPALLLPYLYPVAADQPRHGVGVIPHFVDAARARVSLARSGVRLIDVGAPIERVISQATSCELLLSSSLHGCILGDAYGIPTAWVRISDQVLGDGFKFRDYYAATGRPARCVDWREKVDLEAGVAAARRAAPPRIDLSPLLGAFPYLRRSISGLEDIPRRPLERRSA